MLQRPLIFHSSRKIPEEYLASQSTEKESVFFPECSLQMENGSNVSTISNKVAVAKVKSSSGCILHVPAWKFIGLEECKWGRSISFRNTDCDWSLMPHSYWAAGWQYFWVMAWCQRGPLVQCKLRRSVSPPKCQFSLAEQGLIHVSPGAIWA